MVRFRHAKLFDIEALLLTGYCQLHIGYSPSLFGQDVRIMAKFFYCEFMDRDGVKVK